MQCYYIMNWTFITLSYNGMLLYNVVLQCPLFSDGDYVIMLFWVKNLTLSLFSMFGGSGLNHNTLYCIHRILNRQPIRIWINRSTLGEAQHSYDWCWWLHSDGAPWTDPAAKTGSTMQKLKVSLIKAILQLFNILMCSSKLAADLRKHNPKKKVSCKWPFYIMWDIMCSRKAAAGLRKLFH